MPLCPLSILVLSRSGQINIRLIFGNVYQNLVVLINFSMTVHVSLFSLWESTALMLLLYKAHWWCSNANFTNCDCIVNMVNRTCIDIETPGACILLGHPACDIVVTDVRWGVGEGGRMGSHAGKYTLYQQWQVVMNTSQLQVSRVTHEISRIYNTELTHLSLCMIAYKHDTNITLTYNLATCIWKTKPENIICTCLQHRYLYAANRCK